MKNAADFWMPDPAQRQAEIKARRETLERQHLAPIRARVALLRNLRAEQVAIFDRLVEDVLASPRDDELRGAITRLHDYMERRWRDQRNAPAPLSAKTRDSIIKAIEASGEEVTEAAIWQMAANAKAKR